MGRGITLPTEKYVSAMVGIKSHRQFVKNIALTVFGIEKLQNSTVNGNTSNRCKNVSDEV